jgi:four helix bundle protein
MATAKSFEELEVWKRGRTLASELYGRSSQGHFARDFGLRDQIRRAAISIVSNIAEGFERGGNKEFIHFLYIAKGSAAELRSQLYVCLDLHYIDQREFEIFSEQLLSLSRQLNSLIRYLEQTSLTKGINTRTLAQAQQTRRVTNLKP